MDHHCRVANLDIGGGTTNVVLFEDGETLGQRLSGYRRPVNLHEPTGHHYESQSGGSGDGTGGRRVRFCRRQMR